MKMETVTLRQKLLAMPSVRTYYTIVWTVVLCIIALVAYYIYRRKHQVEK